MIFVKNDGSFTNLARELLYFEKVVLHNFYVKKGIVLMCYEKSFVILGHENS